MTTSPEPRGARALALGLTACMSALMAAAIFRMASWYVPVLFPTILGYGVGVALGTLTHRLGVGAPRAFGVLASIGAVLAYAGFQVALWDAVMTFLTDNLASGTDRMASDARAGVAAFLEVETGQQGLWAYLSFTSSGQPGLPSPIGVAGSLGLGPMAAVAVMAIDATVAALSARALFRLRALSGYGEGHADALGDGLPLEASTPAAARDVVGEVDARTLADALGRLDAGDAESAGRALGRPAAAPTHRCELVHAPHGTGAATLEVYELSRGDGGPPRATRPLSSWQAQELLDGARLAAQAE